MKKSTKIILTVIVALPVSYVLLYLYATNPSKGIRFYFPERYAGWVCLTYEKEGMPPLKEEDGFSVVKVPNNGIIKTSSSTGSYSEEGHYIPTYNEYYYYSENGIRKADEMGFGGGYSSRNEGEKAITSYFWISTEGNVTSDYEKYVEGRDTFSGEHPCGLWELAK